MLVAFVPRERSLPQVAALSAAVMIAVQLTVEHWFYLYIPWFLGAMLAAMVATGTGPRQRRSIVPRAGSGG